MSIKTFNGLYYGRKDEMERLRQQQATAPSRAVPGVSEEARRAIDRIELLSLHEQFLDRLDSEAVRCRTQCLAVGVGGGLAVAGGALFAAAQRGAAFAGTIGFGAFSALAVGFAVAGTATYVSTFKARRWTQTQRQEHQAERANLGSRMHALEEQGRSSAEKRVRGAAQKTGGALVLLEQVDKDPQVAAAAQRLDNAERAVAARASLLAADRANLFSADPARMQRVWESQADDCTSTVMMAMGGGALASGLAAGLLFGLEAGAIAGFAVAAASVAAGRLLTKRWVSRCVERKMREEIGQEMQREKSQMEGLRAALEGARQQASTRYSQVAEETVPVSPAPEVRVEADHVMVGGIKVARRDRPSTG